MPIEKFEVGKCYEYNNNRLVVRIVSEIDSLNFGKCFVGESPGKSYLVPVGDSLDDVLNWREVPLSTWDAQFFAVNGYDAEERRAYLTEENQK